MAKYLIDVNLPYYFRLWNNPDYLHVLDLDDKWTDQQIWNYAKEHSLTIISKDSDFSIKALIEGTPPKVIHLKFGNLKIKDFHSQITKVWDDVLLHLENNSIINIYIDRLEMIR
jgi:predicted nuclease of predicted toxin-antitoxin system